MERLNDGPLARALERGRGRLNARVAAAAHEAGGLDGDALAAQLVRTVDPVVAAVAAAQPDRVDAVVEGLLDVTLELLRRPGPGAAAVGRAWRELLAVVPALVAREPRRLAAALSNAAWNLAAEPGARLDDWLGALRALAPLCRDADEFLAAGQVAGWRAGLAHYRESALEVCRRLSPDLASEALGLGQGEPVEPFYSDPWAAPGRAGPRALAVVARLGGFRGFGGVFVCPPEVVAVEGRLYAFDDEAAFSLHADGFGATVRRHGPALPGDPEPAAPGGPVLAPDGALRWGGLRAAFPHLAGASSLAALPSTLAVALPRSHWVWLVAAVPTAAEAPR